MKPNLAQRVAKKVGLPEGDVRAVIEAMRDDLDEDIAAEIECQFSTEEQWTAAFIAALA